jgi:hypothetical protein
MSIYTVNLVTRWQTDAAGNRMQVAMDHPAAGVAFTDVTGQPDANLMPAPNALVVEAYPVNEALLSALEADPNVTVLWSEPDANPI